MQIHIGITKGYIFTDGNIVDIIFMPKMRMKLLLDILKHNVGELLDRTMDDIIRDEKRVQRSNSKKHSRRLTSFLAANNEKLENTSTSRFFRFFLTYGLELHVLLVLFLNPTTIMKL